MNFSEDMDRRKRLAAVTDAMVPFAASSLVGIFGIIREKKAILWGSATLLAHGERRLLLTAGHVLNPKEADKKKLSNTFQYYGHSAGEGKPPQKIVELNRREDEKHDLMLVEVEAASVEGIERNPIPTTIFADHSILAPSDFLFFEGFPGGLSEPRPILELRNKAMGVGTVLVEAEHDGPAPFIYVHYSFTGNRETDGQITEVPDPGGLSGSALWKTNLEYESDTWHSSDARIVGVVASFNEAHNRIGVARVEAVRQLIKTWENENPSVE